MATTPTTATTTPPSTPVLHVINVDYLNESWCELQYKSGCSSTGSISHLNHSVNPEVLEKLLQEAQKEIQSPITLPTCDSTTSSLYFPDLLSSSSSIKQVETSRSLINQQTSLLAQTKNNKSATNKNSSSSSLSSNNNTDQLKNNSNTKFIKTKIIIDNNSNKNSNLVNLNPTNSIIPILNSNLNMYEYDNDIDDDVDLEYVEDDTCDETNLENITSKIEKSSIIMACSGSGVNSSCPGPIVSTPCQNCIKHKKQIDLLIEKQIDNEKELIKLKNEFEIKLLNKSLEISSASSSNNSTSSSPLRSSSNKHEAFKNSNNKSTLTSPSLASSTTTSTTNTTKVSPLNSGSNSPNNNKNNNLDKNNTNNNNTNQNNNDWIKYFSSRPQAQPPKEWNFVHPNSSKSKLNNLRKMDEDLLVTNCENTTKSEQFNYNNLVNSFKLLSKENIGKLLFTHMASFIVGATLMFLVLKRHLNIKSSVYFI